jgi:hypothetical protein
MVDITPSGRGNGFPHCLLDAEKTNMTILAQHWAIQITLNMITADPRPLPLFHHMELGRARNCFLFFTTWSEEDFTSALTNHDAMLLDVWVLVT